MQKGNELKALLMIEGRSIPFTGATIQAQVGQPTTCTINMVPLKEINDILPRTMVHLFVKDYTAPDFVNSKSTGISKPWVLAFEGEVYGFSMSKATSDRQFSIYCMDISNYWDNAKQFYMNRRTSFGDAVNILASNKSATEAEKENTSVKETTSDISSYLVNLVNEKIKARASIIEAIVSIIEGIEEVNPFFRYSNARYRINDRLIFQDAGNLGEIFEFENSENLFQMIAGRGNGGIRTIRQIVQELMGLVFHDFVSCPFPSRTGEVKNGIGEKGTQTIGSFLFKPMNFMLPPPKCNVLFPDHYNSFSFNRIFFHEVTRTKTSARLTAAQSIDNEIKVFNQTYYAPSGYNSFRTAVSGEVDRPQFKNAGVSGLYGDDAKEEIKNSTTLSDFNFLSYEEVLKGIFSDQDNVMPAAQVLSKVKAYDGQTKFFQRAADFLFYKKRLASRQVSANGPLNLAPVPGFSMLLVDNSDAEQHILGTLESMVHSINPQVGGNTSYQLSFARHVEEKDLWDGSTGEPPVPPWYDPEIFGINRAVNSSDTDAFSKDKTAQARIAAQGFVNDFGNSKLDDHYKALLGKTKSDSHYGSESITSPKFPTVLAATLELVRVYRKAKDSGAVYKFINKQTRRDYVELTDVFSFLGAEISDHQKNASREDKVDVIFKGGTFDGGFTSRASDTENARDRELKTLFGDEATKKRRAPLTAYRKRLFTERGFRG